MDQLHQSARYRYPAPAEVAAVLARARHWLPWELEGPVRHRIRVLLILQGCSWDRADWIGHGLVARGRIVNGVRTPTGWDSDHDLSSWIASSACVVCDHAFLPRHPNQETCGQACYRRHRYIQIRPVALRRCEHCRDPMDVTQPSQKFCSTRCRKASEYLRNKHEWGRVRDCQTCGEPIQDSLRGDARFCGEVCRNKWNRERPGAVDARREAYREAAGVVARTSCTHCGGGPPAGSNAKRLYCSGRCNTAALRARKKLNGHANGHDHHANANGSAASDRPGPAGGAKSPGDDRVAAADRAGRAPRSHTAPAAR